MLKNPERRPVDFSIPEKWTFSNPVLWTFYFPPDSPPVRRKRSGLPSASTLAWILVLNPPRLRPSAWLSCPPLFLTLQRRKDALARSCCPAKDFPYLGHWRNVDAYLPIPGVRTSAQSVCKCCSSSPGFPEAVVTGPHCAGSTR